MKPIYFPFTCISLPVLDRLNVFFRQVVVYGPSSRNIPAETAALIDAGRLDVRFPLTGGEGEIDAALKDYRAWTELHGGGATAFFQGREGAVPFFEDTSTAQIRADIRGYAAPERSEKRKLTAAERQFNARIFLLVAQQLDLQNADLDRHLSRVDEMSAALFDGLRGALDGDRTARRPGRDVRGPDSRSYMLPQRLQAFARLAAGDADASGLYVTDSPAAIDTLLKGAPEVKTLPGITVPPSPSGGAAGEPPERQRLGQLMDRLLTTPWSACGAVLKQLEQGKDDRSETALRLYLVPGVGAPAFWAGLPAGGKGAGPSGDGRAVNTLIGLIKA